MKVGDRVFIVGANHPARGSAGTVREIQQLQPLFGGGTGYAVEVDGMAGHRVGCRIGELMRAPEPVKKRRGRKR